MRRPVTLVAMFGWMVATGCTDPSCKIETIPYAVTLNPVSEGGPTIGQTIARFDVTQKFITHTPYGCSDGPLQDVGAIDLTITSIYTVPVTFIFDVQGLNGGNPVWVYHDTITRLAPAQVLTRTRIATSPTQLSQGARVILKNVTPVP